MRLVGIALSLGLMVGAGSPAFSQAFPNRPGQIIVPFAAGGITDILARALSEKLAQKWGQRYAVINRPGANGVIGAEAAARSPADGYTLLVVPDSSFTTIPLMSSKLKYELADFEPVSGLGISPHALVVPPDFPANNFPEFLAYAKQNPARVFYGTFGSGTSGHLNFLYFENKTDARFTPVHYSGASPAISDLLGNHIKAMTVSIGLIAGAWEAGQLKVLAFGASQRLDRFPNVAVIAETLPGFVAGSWYALFAPKGTPPEIVAKLSEATQEAFNDPAFEKQFLAPNYTYSIARGPKDLQERIQRDSELWRPIIRDAKLSME
jgi:tripartite-type tricarboxylate transporter receptor subunit TctC